MALQIFLACIGSTAIVELIKLWFQRKDQKDNYATKSDLAPIKRQQMLSSRRYLKQEMAGYIKRRSITIDEFEELQEEFESYQELGGNGFIKEMFAQVKELL